ncbi:MAG: YraN family protein [Fimbriimonadaceae bacterium]|nr:YraN family protein [Fimbriimonadaceae bacterium]
MSNLRSVGAEAEDQAAAYLVGLGWTVITRRHKTRRGELDIVALDPASESGETLVFVEVKQRSKGEHLPEESVDAKKRRHVIEAANLYLAEFGNEDRGVRFDVIAIDGDGLRHHRDVFNADGIL